MFESPNFKTNIELLGDCAKLVEQHNRLSYQTLSLRVPAVAYSVISKQPDKKNRDPVSTDIISFYESYTGQMATAEKLRELIGTMVYTVDDLTIHIDLSTDSIMEILAALTDTRSKLEEKHARIIENISSATDSLISHIRDQFNDSTNYDNVITTVFTCMKQQGLGDKTDLNEHDHLFVPVGVRIIAEMHQTKRLTDQQISMIKSCNNEMKQVLLGVAQSDKQTAVQGDRARVNHLQTFGFVPSEGMNTNLDVVVGKLLGLTIPPVDSFANAQEPLTNMLKLATADTGISTGLIILASKNADSYFDMSSLFELGQTNSSAGVTADMVKTFDLIKEGNPARVKSSELITINVVAGVTQQAYLLWTNDMVTFKSQSQPISKESISKLLRRAPSATIAAYNSAFEKSIADARDEDAISFNRVKYMSFNNDVTEETYLDTLQSKLVKNIIAAVGKLKDAKLKDAIVDQSFANMLLDTIDSTKMDLGIHAQMLPSHSHIIYASMANSIVARIKKSLVVLDRLDKASLNDIVKILVRTNDNIYSRAIASYYLHMA